MFSFFLGFFFLLFSFLFNLNLFFASGLLISWMFVLLGFLQTFSVGVVATFLSILFLGGLMVFFCYSVMLLQKQDSIMLYYSWDFFWLLFFFFWLIIFFDMTHEIYVVTLSSIFDLINFFLLLGISFTLLTGLFLSISLCFLNY